MVNTKEYEDGMCESCNDKIKVYMAGLTKNQLILMGLTPKKFAKEMAGLICKRCTEKIQNKLRGGE